MKKILVCGVGNSENLGDRIIAESMNYIVNTSNFECEVSNFDFTEGLMNGEIKNAKVRLNTDNFRKKITPNSLRRLKTRWKYKRNTQLNYSLTEIVKNQNLIIIGGGHLLIDNYLNFPIGIEKVIKEAEINNIPVIFAFVGAKGPWSWAAKKKYLKALEYAKYISVRDEDSKSFLLSMNNKLSEKVISLSDPALFVSEMSEFKIKESQKKKIGLGIMDPNEMIRHSDFRWGRDEATKWWSYLAKGFILLGYEVNIFTNGATTDNGFVEYHIKKELVEIEGIKFIDYPNNYKDLLSTIQEQDVIVAQRLHSCLPAISYGKSTFGVIWDRKLSNIFSDLGLQNYLVHFNNDIDDLIRIIHKQVQQDNKEKSLISNNIKVKKKEMQKFVAKGIKEI